jgi:predicted amidophosphoribosyltransferase
MARSLRVIRTSAQQRNHFVEAPNVIANSCFHRWRGAQRMLNPAELVANVMEHHGVLQILKLLLNTLVEQTARTPPNFTVPLPKIALIVHRTSD